MRFKSTHRRLSFEALEPRLALSNYYVGPTGNDSAAGTIKAPFQTIQHAADLVKAGDTVTVESGTYAGFSLYTSGTSSAPVTFAADPNVLINQPSLDSGSNNGIDIEGASYVVVRGFNVVGMPGAGIDARLDSHVSILNNVCDQNGVWGIYTSHSDYLDIEGNTASRSVNQHGIYVANACVNPIVRGNTIWGNADCGIHMNGDASQGGTGVITGALVERNLIYDNGTGGGAAINCDGVQSSRFQNNLIYNVHQTGIALFRQDAAAGSINDVVVNNTIVVAADGKWALSINNGSTRASVSNNILYDLNTARGSICISSNSRPGFASDHNVVMNEFTANYGTSRISLAKWQSKTGQDKHSILAPALTTLFVDPSSGNYRLAPLSPAIGAGTAYLAPSVDITSKSRPTSSIDIGCYCA